MSPIPQLAQQAIEKRSFWGFDDDYYGNSGWNTWGRWVLLGIIIGVAVLLAIFLQCATCRRVRHGQRPIQGTAWMVPPSYYQSQQQYQNDPLPVYKAEPGEGDAGRYNGNEFVPVSEAPNGDYAPPEGPPPAHMGPPRGPPPSHTGPDPTSSNAEYYRPPEGPPPGHSDIAAPPAAKYKT